MISDFFRKICGEIHVFFIFAYTCGYFGSFSRKAIDKQQKMRYNFGNKTILDRPILGERSATLTAEKDDRFLLRLSEEMARLTLPSGTAEHPSILPEGGIGELGEKSLHQCLKRCYAPDERHREVKLGRYIADVYDGERIVEIQTGHLQPLLPKLRACLSSEIAPVTVVHPMARVKYLTWIDPETGEMTKPR